MSLLKQEYNINQAIRYVIADIHDELFGLIVTTVGKQEIKSQSNYPPASLHPHDYYFNPIEGRVLHEFQLVYITSGQGILKIEGIGEFTIKSGNLFVLFPGIRHSYTPEKSTGRSEFWIGFKGRIMDDIVSNSFISMENPVLKIGHNERIVDLYLKAIAIAAEGRAGYQQALAGIVIHLLGLSYYRNRSSRYDNTEILSKMNKAKLIMRECVYQSLDLDSVAASLNMSYSTFRKTFKDVIGVSPSYYYQQLKLDEAKLLLATSNISIKELAFKLNYDNPESFSVFFKNRTSYTPSKYRDMQ